MLKKHLYFVVDPMCSWCWGFTPVIEETRKIFSGTCHFSLVLGGLRTQGEMQWNEASKAYLKAHWQQVAQSTGQLFNDELFEKELFEYDTYPACKAVVTVRELLGADAAFAYLHALQNAFYTQGIDITRARVLQGYYEQLFGNSSKFAFFYASERAEILMQHDFAKARSMGANVFPSVVFVDGEGHMVCQKGYRSFLEMRQLLQEEYHA
ncbi:DsbA family protein [Sulfurovum sp. ST-21]|uniref:DsbA family protein n=1 Tax=Sulfurovum indicum TaxID=2779528 RepID=A0A7M1S2E0_9BACT|nr:DsbA family protein [Sulfurovum indicum]QOR61613.1 DsbA family protein [Sulfurovum indicum]